MDGFETDARCVEAVKQQAAGHCVSSLFLVCAASQLSSLFRFLLRLASATVLYCLHSFSLLSLSSPPRSLQQQRFVAGCIQPRHFRHSLTASASSHEGSSMTTHMRTATATTLLLLTVSHSQSRMPLGGLLAPVVQTAAARLTNAMSVLCVRL